MHTDLIVRGMHCMSCKNLIEEDLGDLPGVKSVLVDLYGGRAHVEYDEELVTPKILVQQITELGYQAEITERKDPGHPPELEER